MKVGFIGLGHMGLPMARNLLAAGHQVSGFDLAAPALTAFNAAGGSAATSIADAVADAEIVLTMLPAGRHVEVALVGDGGAVATAGPATLFIDCSTIDVGTARAVAQTLSRAGHRFVDAPVSGGVGGAEAGSLTFMAGGEPAAIDQARPLFDAMGQKLVHTGAVGTGQAAKACNNMLLAISMIGTCEAFHLADQLGLERQKLFDVAASSSGQCWSLTSYCPVPGPVPAAPSNRGYQPGFAVDLMLKDLGLALDAAARQAVSLPLATAARHFYQAMAQAGQGGRDFSAAFLQLQGGTAADDTPPS